MRVGAGRYKGRPIPFETGRFGDIRVTSGMVKGSAFSMLGEDLTGCRFLDLCGGSGQMGLEACSRGADVVVNEPDRRRRAFVTEQVEALGCSEVVCVHGCLAEDLVTQLDASGDLFDAAYVDPPYEATAEDGTSLSEFLLRVLGASNLIAPDGAVLIQHGKRQELPDTAGALEQLRQNQYGDTRLSLFGRAARKQ